MSHIKLSGAELEGAYNKFNFEISKGWKYDGSIKDIPKEYKKCLKACDCKCSSCKISHQCCQRIKYQYVGEVASDPMKINDLLFWVNENYPDFTNRSCGLHLHFSFNSVSDYARLMERRFYYYLLDKLEEFGRLNKLNKDGIFWERIKGKNTFCKKEFIPEIQASHKKKDSNSRYTIANACYYLYGTYELRVLPCFQKKKLSLKAIRFVYDTIENYLSEKHTQIPDRVIKVKLCDIEKYKNLKIRIKDHEKNMIYKKKMQRHRARADY